MRYFIIMLVFGFIGNAQNNIIPNPGFEATNPVTTNCIFNNVAQFNSVVNNWKQDKNCHDFCVCPCSQTDFINLANCAAIPSCDHTGTQRFVWLTTEILSNNCSNRRRDNVGVALENGEHFPVEQTFVIRYKYVRTGGLVENGANTTCGETTFNHLRVFASQNGPLNWRDNSNIVEELFSANLQSEGKDETCLWKSVQRTFQITTQGMTTLAFLVESGGFFLDDVEVFPLCDDNYLIQNKDYSLFFNTYAPFNVEGNNLKEEAGAILTAGSSVGLGNVLGPVTIGSSAGENTRVVYTAQSTINLRDGFKVFAGATFGAKLDPACPNNITGKVGLTPNRVGFVSELIGDDISDDEIDHSESLMIYPNPISSILHIDNYPKDCSVSIYDLLGKEVGHFTEYSDHNISIDLGYLESGFYSVFVFDNNGNILSSTKLIKE